MKGEGKTDTSTENPVEIPGEVKLFQNYPNPFNPSTQIRYSLPYRAPVTLNVYDIMGRRVATLVDNIQDAGTHQATYDASGLASGMYIYRLQTPNMTVTRQIMFVK